MKAIDFKCPNCQASLHFPEGKDVCECEFCGSEVHLSKVCDDLQKENAAGIKELTDRAYDLIRQRKYVKAAEVANEGLNTYPYAGRLHLVLLLSELNVEKPSLLGSYGKDYTGSTNYQNCVRYMTEEDKADLASLVERNAPTIKAPEAPAPTIVTTVAPGPNPNTMAVGAAAIEAYANAGQKPAEAPAPEEDEEGEEERGESESEAPVDMKGQKKKIIFFSSAMGIGVVLFIVFLILALNIGIAGQVMLILYGLFCLLIAFIGYKIIDYHERVICPKCHYKPRKHTRIYVDSRYVNKKGSNVTVVEDTYDDYWTCPKCGERLHRIKKIENRDGHNPHDREIF